MDPVQSVVLLTTVNPGFAKSEDGPTSAAMASRYTHAVPHSLQIEQAAGDVRLFQRAKKKSETPVAAVKRAERLHGGASIASTQSRE